MDENLLLFCEHMTGAPSEACAQVLKGDPLPIPHILGEDEAHAIRVAAKLWHAAEENCDDYEDGVLEEYHVGGVSDAVTQYRTQNDVEGGWTTMDFLGHSSMPHQSHCPTCGIHKPQGFEP